METTAVPTVTVSSSGNDTVEASPTTPPASASLTPVASMASLAEDEFLTIRSKGTTASPTRSKFNIHQSSDTARFKMPDTFQNGHPRGRDLDASSRPHLTVEAAVFRDPSMFQSDKAPPTQGTSQPKSGSEAATRSKHARPKRYKKRAQNITPAEIFAQNLSDAVLDADAGSDDDAFVYSGRRHYRTPLPSTWVQPDAGNEWLPNKEKQRPRRPVLRSTISDLPSYAEYKSKSYPGYAAWDPSDEERPLLPRTHTPSPPRLRSRYRTQARASAVCWIIFSALIALLIAWAMILLLLATPLLSVQVVGLTNVLGTQKQLIFDLHVHARNNNWWAVQVSHAAFSVFASSRYVPTEMHMLNESQSALSIPQPLDAAEPAEFLGTIYDLAEPLVFSPATFLHSTDSTAISQIQIKNPGETKGDIAGNERWSLLIRYPYELTLRGVIRYRLLPLGSQYHSARVCFVASVDPATGRVTAEPLLSTSICDVTP